MVPIVLGLNDPHTRLHIRRGLGLLAALVASVILARYNARLGNALFALVVAVDIIAFVQTVYGYETH